MIAPRRRTGRAGWLTGRLTGRLAAAIVALLVSLISTYTWRGRDAAVEPTGSGRTSASGAASGSAPGAETTRGFTDHAGRVTQISDGDTVRFLTDGRELRIRIDSIDAPEKAEGAARPGQDYAQASRENLSRWIKGRTVTARCFETDQYGRSVCALRDEAGESAGRAQVAAGYAWAYTAAHGRYLRDADMTRLQAEARQARRGLWAQPDPAPPWQWRYNCWRERHCQ